jgi:hypothetical protein
MPLTPGRRRPDAAGRTLEDSRSPIPSTTEECGRSTARQAARPAPAGIAVSPGSGHQGWRAIARRRGSAPPAVDKVKGPSLYTPSTVRPPPRRDGAPMKPSLRRPSTSFRSQSEARVAMALRGFAAGPPVPGCLTGESEERETWTAGSLRAASSREGAAGRDFGGTRFRSHHGSRERSEVTDLVKRCDQPVQVLIQPESLILAQSERWRQA